MSPALSSALALALRWPPLRDSAGPSVAGALAGATVVCCTTVVAGTATAARCATGALCTEVRAPSVGMAATVVAAGDAVTAIGLMIADLGDAPGEPGLIVAGTWAPAATTNKER